MRAFKGFLSKFGILLDPSPPHLQFPVHLDQNTTVPLLGLNGS